MSLAKSAESWCNHLIDRKGVVSVCENGMTTKLFNIQYSIFKGLWCYLHARYVKNYLVHVHECCFFGEWEYTYAISYAISLPLKNNKLQQTGAWTLVFPNVQVVYVHVLDAPFVINFKFLLEFF